MGKISIEVAKEMLKIFCKKYEIEGELQETATGGTLVSPLWCENINRTCALSFVLDSSDGSLTFSLVVGRAKDSKAYSYAQIINKNKPGGFTTVVTPKTELLMLSKIVSYENADENFFMILYNLLQIGLQIINSEMFSLCAEITNPL